MHYSHPIESGSLNQSGKQYHWIMSMWLKMLVLKDSSSKDTEVSTEISKMDILNYIMMIYLSYQIRM